MKRNLVILMLGLVLFGGCRSAKKTQDVGKIVVKADTVKDHQGDLVIVYPGRIKAASDVNLAFRVSGPILKMPVEEGAFVKKGTLLAAIDPRDYEIQFAATEAEYKQVKAEAERVMELYRRGSVPVNDNDKAVSGLQRITAKYEAHKNALQDTRLLAPFDGFVQKKFFDAHETVGAGMPIIAMINSGYFEVEIDIPSSDYIRQHLFKSFFCTADVFPGKQFPLEFIEITKKANLNQLYRIRLRLKPQQDVPLAAGMSVNVTIEYKPEINALVTIPLSSIFEDNGEVAVWVYQTASGTVTKRPVKLKKIMKTGVAIVADGLKVGEIVISAGVHELKEGMQVELLKRISDTNIGGLL